MDRYRLRLFVAGNTGQAQRTIQTLRDICEAELSDRYELMVVDVLGDPGAAEKHHVLAAPMLVKETPAPARRLVGKLSSREQVCEALGLPRRETGAASRATADES